MKILFAWLGSLVLMASPLQAAGMDAPDPVSPEIQHPQYEKVPSANQFLQYYPLKARQALKTGVLTIRCKVVEEGRLGDCAVLSEEPVGYDFAAGALNLSRIFRLKPKTTDGASVVGGTFTTRIRFKLAN